MKLAVSNIAWPPYDRLTAYELLERHAITGLEIAPGLFFEGADDPFRPDAATLTKVMSEIAAAGLQLVSMQSLLFGVEGAALFGPQEARKTLRAGMLRAIDLAEILEIPNLVFGAPKQRIVPKHMSSKQAQEEAAEIFAGLGDAAAAAGTRIAIEFNPAAYGTNFLTHAETAIDFVQRLDHPAVVLNFDIGAMHMNEDFDRLDILIPDTLDRIGHVHVSEPYLAPAPAQYGDAKHIFEVLRASGYVRWASLEMVTPEGGLNTLDRHVARLALAARDAEALT